MSNNSPGRKKGYVTSALTKARQSVSLRHSHYENLDRKHEKERKHVLRSVVEAEALLARLEAEAAGEEV